MINEIKDIWDGPQEVGLDPTTATFLNDIQYNNTCRTRLPTRNVCFSLLEHMGISILGFCYFLKRFIVNQILILVFLKCDNILSK